MPSLFQSLVCLKYQLTLLYIYETSTVTVFLECFPFLYLAKQMIYSPVQMQKKSE